MATRNEIVAFCNEHLDAAGYPDSLPVGLQVPGAAEVAKVASGVSASLELFQRAAAAGAQLLLVHHGLFWDREPRRLGDAEKARLKALFDADLSLVAYHLCLDAHPEVGNNAVLCGLLGLERLEGFGVHGGRTIGFVGSFDPPVPASGLLQRVRSAINLDPLAFMHGPDPVRRVAVISGGAAGDLTAAAEAGADAFVTGEAAEPTMARAAELGMHFVAAGHYATEVFGVRALGDLVAQRFGVGHVFIDIPNPV